MLCEFALAFDCHIIMFLLRFMVEVGYFWGITVANL